MPEPPDDLESHLAPVESLVQHTRGRIVNGSRRSEGYLGVTDHRLLFIADGDHFLDVSHDSICSIRSEHRSRLTVPGIGYPLLAAGGALVTLVGLFAIVLLAPTAVGVGLALLTVGGGIAAELLRRSDVSLDPQAVRSVRRAVSGDISSRRRELRDIRPILQGPYEGSHHYADGFVLGTALLALLGLVGLVAASGTLAVVPVVLLSFAGFAVADVGYHRATALEDASRLTALDVKVDLVNGRTVEFRVDPDVRLDRTLSATRRSTPEESAQRAVQPSTAGAARTQ